MLTYRHGIAVLLLLCAFSSAAYAVPPGITLTVSSTGPTSDTAFATSPGNSVTLTASVPALATGTVTFTEGGSKLNCSEGNPVMVNSGSAVCTITYASASSEGYHTYTASYSGDQNNEPSSTTASVFVYNHATSSGTTYCNSNGISAPSSTATPALYPSVIYVGDGTSGSPSLNFSAENVSVQLMNFTSNNTRGVQMLLVSPDGKAFQFWGSAGTVATNGTGNYTLQDLSPQLPQTGAISPGTYGPSVFGVAFFPVPLPDPNPQLPSNLLTSQIGPPQGTGSFGMSFNGAASNGPWALYLYDASENGFSTSEWCIDITPASGYATTVGLTSNATNSYATEGASVTFTATVASAGNGKVNEGTVTFTDTNTLSGIVTVLGSMNVTNGTAVFATSALAEGDRTITATYHDSTGTFNDNYGTLAIRVNSATQSPVFNQSAWIYCNPSGITIPAGTIGSKARGPASPNPSNIFVTNLWGTIDTMSLTVDNFTLIVPGFMESLLVGPNGSLIPTAAQTLDFFSPFDVGALTPFSGQNVTFADIYAPIPANANPGTMVGTQVGPTSNSPTSYIASPFYTLPTSLQQATTAGRFTFTTGLHRKWRRGIHRNESQRHLEPVFRSGGFGKRQQRRLVVLEFCREPRDRASHREPHRSAPITISCKASTTRRSINVRTTGLDRPATPIHNILLS